SRGRARSRIPTRGRHRGLARRPNPGRRIRRTVNRRVASRGLLLLGPLFAEELAPFPLGQTAVRPDDAGVAASDPWADGPVAERDEREDGEDDGGGHVGSSSSVWIVGHGQRSPSSTQIPKVVFG